MSIDIAFSKGMISQVQLGQILSLPFMENLPTYGATLAYCRSLAVRRKGIYWQPLVPDQQALERWNDARRLCFLVTENHKAFQAMCFLINIIDLLRQHGLPVLWALRSSMSMYRGDSSSSSSSTSPPFETSDMVRMLLYQALQLNPSVLNTGINPITIGHLRDASSEADWIGLLKRALQGLSVIYIIFDSDLVEAVSQGISRRVATTLFMEFARILGSDIVKLVAPFQCFGTAYASQDLCVESIVTLRTENRQSTQLQALRRRRTRRARRSGR